MKKIVIFILPVFLAGILFFYCCTKEKSNPVIGSVVFWFGKSTSDSLVANGSDSLIIKFDSVVVGKLNSNYYFTGTPSCGQNGAVTVEKNMGDLQSKIFFLNIFDEHGNLIISSVPVNVKANMCNPYRIWY